MLGTVTMKGQMEEREPFKGREVYSQGSGTLTKKSGLQTPKDRSGQMLLRGKIR